METYTAESTLHCDSCSISAHEMDKESVGDKESEFLVQIKGPCSSEGTLWAFQASFTKKSRRLLLYFTDLHFKKLSYSRPCRKILSKEYLQCGSYIKHLVLYT